MRVLLGSCESVMQAFWGMLLSAGVLVVEELLQHVEQSQLVQWPILTFINYQFSGIHNHNPHEPANFLAFAGVVGICIVCAYFFALLTERHTSRVRGILSRRLKLDYSH